MAKRPPDIGAQGEADPVARVIIAAASASTPIGGSDGGVLVYACPRRNHVSAEPRRQRIR